jgi:hypothetical protein
VSLEPEAEHIWRFSLSPITCCCSGGGTMSQAEQAIFQALSRELNASVNVVPRLAAFKEGTRGHHL